MTRERWALRVEHIDRATISDVVRAGEVARALTIEREQLVNAGLLNAEQVEGVWSLWFFAERDWTPEEREAIERMAVEEHAEREAMGCYRARL